MINKRYLKFILASVILVIILELIPFVIPIRLYNPIAGVYFELHGTYAVAIDYSKQVVDIPSHFLLRPVTETDTVGVRSKGSQIVEEITIPVTVTKINAGSFSGYNILKIVSGAKNVEIIGDGAFQSDDSLIEIPYFEKAEIIKDYAFQDCKISHLKLPNSIKEIGDYAFAYNNISKLDVDLNKVELGSAVFKDNPFQNEMGEFAIYPDGSLQCYNGSKAKIVIPESVIAISGAFDDYENDNQCIEIYIPETVESIKNWSFWIGTEARVFVPDSIEYIEDFKNTEGQCAFYEDEVTIVTTQGSYAEEFAKKYNIDYEIVDEIVVPEGSAKDK